MASLEPENSLAKTECGATTQTGKSPPLRVSVIVCVYNRPKQIITCLESLLQQDYRPLEIVIVDDGSTDETPEVLAHFCHDHRSSEIALRVLTNERNLGLCGARNRGLEAARGQ